VARLFLKNVFEGGAGGVAKGRVGQGVSHFSCLMQVSGWCYRVGLRSRHAPLTRIRSFKAFADARVRANKLEQGKAGGLKSAETQAAATEAAAKTIENAWRLPEDHPDYESDEVLIKRAGVSRNSIKNLGHRDKAQRIFIAARKRKSTKKLTGARADIERSVQ
jgi:hypothetical protein